MNIPSIPISDFNLTALPSRVRPQASSRTDWNVMTLESQGYERLLEAIDRLVEPL